MGLAVGSTSFNSILDSPGFMALTGLVNLILLQLYLRFTAPLGAVGNVLVGADLQLYLRFTVVCFCLVVLLFFSIVDAWLFVLFVYIVVVWS